MMGSSTLCWNNFPSHFGKKVNCHKGLLYSGIVAKHLKNSRKDVYFALKHLVSGQEKAVCDCCAATRRRKPGKTLNFAQLSTYRGLLPPSLGARLQEMGHGEHRRPLAGWASLGGRSMRQRSPLKAEAAPGKPLFCCPPNAGVATGASDVPFPLPAAQPGLITQTIY